MLYIAVKFITKTAIKHGENHPCCRGGIIGFSRSTTHDTL
jgi:hypothetical protein